MNPINRRRDNFLCAAGRPFNFNPIHTSYFAEAKVETPLILGAKSATPGHFLDLLLTFPE
jgi:hypothetical protein